MENGQHLISKTAKLNVLTEVCTFINSELPQEQQLRAIVDAANKLIGIENSSLIIYDEEHIKLRYHLVTGEKSQGLMKLSIYPGQGIAGWVATNGIPLVVPDVTKESRYDPEIRKKLDFEIHSILCVPIRSGKKVIGAFEALNRLDNSPFDENDLPLLNAFVSLIGTVLDNAQSKRTVDQQNLELEKLVRSKTQEVEVANKNLTVKAQRLALTTKIISVINSNRNLTDILIEIAKQIRRLLPFDYLTVALIQDDKKTVRLQEVYPSPKNPASEVIKIPLDDPVVAYAMKYKRSLFYNRPRWYHCFLKEGRFLEERLSTMFCTPIMTADAIVLGTLNLGSLQEQAYPKKTVNIVTFLAKQLGIAFERQRMRKTLEKLNHELNDKTFELRKNIITMGDANLKLFEAQQELREKDKKMKSLLTEVQEKNEELNTTLIELKQTQTQLVQSEKMASLGQLVAGIAHELNTPAGAIKAASEVIPEYIQKTFLHYETLLDAEITPAHREMLRELLRGMVNIAKEPERKTTSEIRRQSKHLEQSLKEHHVENSRSLAKNIARCYLENQFDSLLELFTHYPPKHVMEFFNYCSRVLISSRDNQISVGTISKIVRALKSYSYLDQSQERKVDLNEDIENTLTILHSQIPENTTIVRKFGVIPHISCLGSELNQVWTNILQNALQALDGKEGTITLETLPASQGEGVIVKITDDGPGIPAEIQGKIFDPFFTTQRGKTSGLGLSVTQQVIEKHHGMIQVDSIPGNTTFEVRLPKDGIDFRREAEKFEIPE